MTVGVHTSSVTHDPGYSEQLPPGLIGLIDHGVGLSLQLNFFVEQYIKKFYDKGMFHGPQASQLQVQLNTLTDAYGRMETIRLTAIPVAHLCALGYPLFRSKGQLADRSAGSIRSRSWRSLALSFPSPLSRS